MENASVAADEMGNFIVVWHHPFAEAGGGNGVFGRWLDGSRFQVNTYTPGVQKPLSGGAVSSDPLGNLVVVWQSEGQDGSGYGIFGQRLAPLAAGHDHDFKP